MIGKLIVKLDIIDSTNNYLKKQDELFNDGTVVVAKTQTAGRGRSNHQWVSEEGNLYFSFLVKRNISRNKIFTFTVLTSMAVINLLKKYEIIGSIKYPNDILVNNQKICGILIESSGSKELEYVVVGVGFNVNQLDFKDLNQVAVSLRQVTNKEYEIKEIFTNFIKEYNLLEQSDFTTVFQEYLNYSIIINQKVKIAEEIYQIMKITETGEVRVKSRDNKKELILNRVDYKELF